MGILSKWRRSHRPQAAETQASQPPAEDRFVDEGEVGSGGVATVRRVFEKNLLRRLALKRLEPHLTNDSRQVRRFLLEAQITGQLDHPNIVPIHELGRGDDGVDYFTMKLVEGQTLSEKIDEAGETRLDPDRLAELLGILLKVCEALAFAHSRGVIHRDVKPSNIMVGRYGVVYLMDWGVALLLPAPAGGAQRVEITARGETVPPERSGTIIGSPAYMAPEQVEGEPDLFDERTDIFALGATLYHVLTGRPPYNEPRVYKLLSQVLRRDLIPPEEAVPGRKVPPELARIAMKAMAAAPEDRYPSMAELQRDLELFLRGSWHLPSRSFMPGRAIVTEGEEADEAFLITAGHCRVLQQTGERREVLRELGPGEVFGEAAIFSSGPRTATVEAIDEVTVMVVSRDDLTSGLALNSWLGRFVKAVTDRFLEAEGRLRKLDSESP